MLEAGDQGIPRVSRLEYDDERRLVIVEREGKGTAFLPMERVCSMEPMSKGEEAQYELTPDAQRMQKAVEEAQRIEQMRKQAEEDKRKQLEERARQAMNVNHVDAVKEAERIRAEYMKNQPPPETTPFPDGKTPPMYATNAKLPDEMVSSSKSEPPRKKRKYTRRAKKEEATT